MHCDPIRATIGDVMVRPIGRADADMVQAFVGGLSANSRYFRFFQPLMRLPPGMLACFTSVDHRTHMALVGVALVQGQQSIVAEARYAVNCDGTTADVALVVADAWQRRGIATGLLTQLERVAAANGVTRLTGETFAVNEKFLSFARACGFDIWPDTDLGHLRIGKSIAGVAAKFAKDPDFAA